ncbi:hypothetical protein CQ010_01350 [Arthrobacter sp. MYb211]|uniref:hypothetical protein n=1 Tax=unclassified Arthrobacter TaxID=235627 RepID=UPI000CFDCCB7|nr:MULTISPECIES: hypothetical protein [unclassified Arthrobacter]PRA13320.1 hypothetical protein CQ015_03605 [Arthrobacter sp. MYb221]PRC10517.1 hypothetical protein CQ010_01350 [Arthrobacter sp. MYb211]
MKTTDDLAVGEKILVFVPNEGWLSGHITDGKDFSGMYGIHGPAEGRFAHDRRAHISSIIPHPGVQLKKDVYVEAHLLAGQWIAEEGWYPGRILDVSMRFIRIAAANEAGAVHEHVVSPELVRALQDTSVPAANKGKAKLWAPPELEAPAAGESRYSLADMDRRIHALEAAKGLLASSNLIDIMTLTRFILDGQDNA